MQIEAQQAVERKVTFAHTGKSAVRVAVQRQDQRQRVFGHGLRRIGGHAGHEQAQPGGSGDVDVVKARTAQ